MNNWITKSFYALLVSFVILGKADAQDPGLIPIGQVAVQLIYATDGDVSEAGDQVKELVPNHIHEIQQCEHLKFKHYRLLGADKKPILRGYENWASPLSPSKEILLSFEPRKRINQESLQLMIEYWQAGRKIMTSDPTLKKGKPFFLLGPEWRKGRLILEMKILDLKAQ